MARPTDGQPSPAVLLRRRVLPVETFAEEQQRGKLSAAQRLARFGSRVEPVPVALAPGQSEEQYETQFRRWLRSRSATLSEMTQDPNRERSFRISYALYALRMYEAMYSVSPREPLVDPNTLPDDKDDTSRARPSRDCSGGEPVAKKHKLACAGRESVAACRACGCGRCLLMAMQLLAGSISSLEGVVNAHDDTLEKQHPAELAKSSSELVENRAETKDVINDGNVPDDDSIEQQLFDEFDEINEAIIMNQDVLDASAVEISELVQTDLAEAMLRQAEDDELHSFLVEEMDRRRAALAALLLYLHRDDLRGLTTIIHTEQATATSQVQQLGYRKCMQLTNQITETRARLDGEQQHELEGTKPSPAEQARYRSVKIKLKLLLEQRRRQLNTLVHFDSDLCEHIRSLLVRATL